MGNSGRGSWWEIMTLLTPRPSWSRLGLRQLCTFSFCNCTARQNTALWAKGKGKAARRQATAQPADTAAQLVVPVSKAQPQRRRVWGLSGVSSKESASPEELPPVPEDDSDADHQTVVSAIKEEADLQEDAALADSLNTALPLQRHQDEGDVAATQEDVEEEEGEEEEKEGEKEEEEGEDEKEGSGPHQARGAPPPVGGEGFSGVLRGCLGAQARDRRQLHIQGLRCVW